MIAAVKRMIPGWKNALLSVFAAILLILAFPDFEFWFLAWFALVPLMWAVEREKASPARSFMLGWLFGTIFFFGTCWWLTFAPITYAGFPWPLAYFLMLCVSVAVGLFPALFTGVLSVLIRRFGSWAFLAAPFVWVFTEFLRYWLTGNNWNAIGYSQAFVELWPTFLFWTASLGGVLLTSGLIVLVNCLIANTIMILTGEGEIGRKVKRSIFEWGALVAVVVIVLTFHAALKQAPPADGSWTSVIAIQPNVPMTYLEAPRLAQLRQRQIDRAETEIERVRSRYGVQRTVVVLPESPMNFMYNDDREFQQFIGDFARRNDVSVLFNSAEPDPTNGKYFNSAVMVSPEGRETAQYDKIYLLPFGEAVPMPLEGILPGFVGNFSHGREYDLFPVGDVKAGVMICFESHFGQLSREYVRNGADVIIEMTNDGYLGPTPVLRQHFANAVFRAAEINRPVLRVTNVGITERVERDGSICDSFVTCGPEPYSEGAAVWAVTSSDESQTFYVRYGDWVRVAVYCRDGFIDNSKFQKD